MDIQYKFHTKSQKSTIIENAKIKRLQKLLLIIFQIKLSEALQKLFKKHYSKLFEKNFEKSLEKRQKKIENLIDKSPNQRYNNIRC